MIHLFADIAQVFFAQIQNSEKIFYSFSHKNLSAFRGTPKIGIFVKSAQVRAIYRGNVFLWQAEPAKY
jgi:hypothetical protein